MSFFGKAFAKIGGLGRRLKDLLGGAKAPPQPSQPQHLQELTNFGSNPGNTRMFAYVPRNLARKPALVVALHGCAQTAALYDRGSGWSVLAEELGFLVVYPEQRRANNPQGCFSWFVPGNVARDQGEALSIRQIVEHAARKFNVDERRVFVTGLSAGGAMASAMLATYPDVFSAGAIIAGLPYGCATTVEEAFAAMFGNRRRSAQPLGDHVRTASQHDGPWPRISIWHGSSDTIVRPVNTEEIVEQWVDVHGLAAEPTREDVFERAEFVASHRRRVWEDADGEPIIEVYNISGMGHGVPIAVAPNPESCGAMAPFFIPVGISSTRRIAQFWGLSKATERKRAAPSAAAASARPPLKVAGVPAIASSIAWEGASAGARARRARNASAVDPNAVIAAAFEAAGLPVPRIDEAAARAGRVEPGPLIAAALKAAGLAHP